MKVRLKQGCQCDKIYRGEHQVLEESAGFYICEMFLASPSGPVALSKMYWEPVPADHWQDVTGECDLVCKGTELCLSGDAPHVGMPNGYRFRKVQLFERLERTFKATDAFIVERKVSE